MNCEQTTCVPNCEKLNPADAMSTDVMCENPFFISPVIVYQLNSLFLQGRLGIDAAYKLSSNLSALRSKI